MNKKIIASFIIALFVVSFIPIPGFNEIKNVNAAPVCCEKASSGATCQYVDESECAAGKSAPTNCIFTSFCKLGTCFDLNDGRCYANMPLATCAARGETASFSDLPVENTPQCDVGCCIIGNQASLITQTRCKKETAKYPDLQMVFKEEVKDEVACVELSRSSDKGCCVQSSDNCIYTTKANCPVPTGTDLASTGFFKNRFCSNPELICDVTSHAKKGCLGGSDDVYWFDSAGNSEDIAEDCDYVDKQSTCGKDKLINDYKCVKLNCDAELDIFNLDGKAIYASGSEVKNGESWCEYDVNMDKFKGKNSLVAFGRDVPGSRYYRGVCINNKIFTEPCKDFREEWCISDSMKIGTEGYNVAACRLNRWQDCVGQKKKDCDNTDLRDCMWRSGKCVPFVSPGSKFWEQENTDICSQANNECEVIVSIPGLTKMLGEEKGGKTSLGELLRIFDEIMRVGGVLGEDGIAEEPEVVAGEDCLKHTYTVSQNNFCRSLGDCGAHFNILGEEKSDSILEGFSITSGKNIQDIVKKAKGGGDPGAIGFNDLDNWVGMAKPDDSADEVDMFKESTSAGLKVFMENALFKSVVIGGYALAAEPHFISAFSRNVFAPLGRGLAKGVSIIPGIGKTIEGWLKKAIGQNVAAEGSKFAIYKSSDQLVTQAMKKLEKEVSNDVASLIYDEVTKVALKAGDTGSPAYNKAFTEAYLEAAKKVGIDIAKRTAFGSIMLIINIASYIQLGLMVIDIVGTDTISEKIITKCEPWQAPKNSKDCEKCNPDDTDAPSWRTDKKCSEYTCKSFGQSCVLLNEGTGNETCVSQNPRDVTPPKINAWKEGLGIYKDKITELPNRGYTYKDIIPAFTIFPMAIETDEPAQCRASLNNTDRFKDISGFFGSGIYDYNHISIASIPNSYGISANGTIVPIPGQSYTLYIKCQDSLGNENDAPYYIKYTIQQGPDVTPPIIEGSSISDNSYFMYGINQTEFELYVNEIADCKWSQTNQDYASMENAMTRCTINDLGLYTCKTTLKPLIDQIVNKFYFRCKDNPNAAEKDRNVNSQSFELTLRGSYPLNIDSIEPSGIIHTRNFTMKVETSKGATYDGKSYCYYGSINDVNQMNLFFKTNSSVHEQVLSPARRTGLYKYFVTCIDYGGNMANTSTEIAMEQDTRAPMIMSIYKDESYTPARLKIILNEIADCQYKIGKDFTYGDGVLMTTDNAVQEAVYEEGATYYIRCLDPSNNLMLHIFHA